MSKKDLTAAFEKFNEKHTFKPGDIVEWKPGMKNRRADGPFIVCAVLSDPIYHQPEGGIGSPYFNEPSDIVLGCVGGEVNFMLLHCDSRRLQPAE